MSLADWASGKILRSATATPATSATDKRQEALSVATVATVAVAGPQTNALAVVKAAHVRMSTHRGNRIIAVAATVDTPELRQALATLGYGSCRVLHLDVAPLKGQGVEAVAAAIEAMEGTQR